MAQNNRGGTSARIEPRKVKTRIADTWTDAEAQFTADVRHRRRGVRAVTIRPDTVVLNPRHYPTSTAHERSVGHDARPKIRSSAAGRSLYNRHLHSGSGEPLRRRDRRGRSRPAPSSNVPTALVADADAKTRGVSTRSLRTAGWHVDEATDGRDALVKALAAPPQVMVTRLDLPLIDGSSLCHLLRRDHHTARVRIVALVERSESAQRMRAAAAGAHAVLALPLMPEQLVDVSNSLLRPAATACDSAAPPPVSRAPHRRSMRSRQETRFRTTSPPNPPRPMRCPLCDASLKYDYSYIGGVNERRPEQWDVLVCVASANCGAFEYRHRTRKMRRIP